MTIACSKNSVQILELKKEGKTNAVRGIFKSNDIKIGQRLIECIIILSKLIW